MLSAEYITTSKSDQQEILFLHQTTGTALQHNYMLEQTTTHSQHLTFTFLYLLSLHTLPCLAKSTSELLLAIALEGMMKMIHNIENSLTLTAKRMTELGLWQANSNGLPEPTGRLWQLSLLQQSMNWRNLQPQQQWQWMPPSIELRLNSRG